MKNTDKSMAPLGDNIASKKPIDAPEPLHSVLPVGAPEALHSVLPTRAPEILRNDQTGTPISDQSDTSVNASPSVPPSASASVSTSASASVSPSVSTKKSDRRIAYTKLALRGALIKLMQDQHISGITVKSICELANINRGTFYLHYKDQYDLLHQIEQEVLRDVRERMMESTQRKEMLKRNRSARQKGDGQNTPKHIQQSDSGPITLEAMTNILEYAKENAAVARVLLSENCDFAFQQDIMGLTQLVSLLPDKGFSQRMKDYVITYGTNGCVALAEKWLADGMIEPPEEFAKLMLQVLYFGTSSFAPTDKTSIAATR